MSHVRVEHVERVAVVTLVDEARRNAFTPAMVDEIGATFDGLEADPGVGAVVVTGADPAFCSGAALSELGQISEGSDREQALLGIYEGFLRVLRSPLPTVAAVNGPAVGAGLNLALACDVRLAGRGARFDCRFVRLGLHPGGGHTWLLEQAVGAQTAAAMLLFGAVLDADAAVAHGLAWQAVDDAAEPGALRAAAVALAANAAGAPRELVARVKDTLRRAAWQPSFDAVVSTEVAHQSWSIAQPWFADARSGRRDRGAR